MPMKRFTKESAHVHPMQKKSYNIPMTRVDNFEMKSFRGQTFMYGDVVNKLGKYEDLGEPEEIAKLLGVQI